MRSIVGFVLWMMMVAISFPGAAGQDRAPTQQSSIRVLVTSVGGQAAAVTAGQLTAAIDNHPVDIQNVVSAKDDPLVFTILMDISGSSLDKQAYEERTALELFRSLATGSNIGHFGDFNDELYLSRKPTTVESVLAELKRIGRFRGGTALYDAVLEGAKLVSSEAKGTSSRRAVFVFTDGEDNASRGSLKGTIAEIQRKGIPIFCIGLIGPPTRLKAIGALQRLADSTGGAAILLSEPRDVVSSLLQHAQNQFWVTMSAPLPPDGKLHSITLQISDKNIRIAAPAAVVLR